VVLNLVYSAEFLTNVRRKIARLATCIPHFGDFALIGRPSGRHGDDRMEPLAKTAAHASAPARIRTVLTVDDSFAMRDILRAALTAAGFTVLQAEDGEAALALLETRAVDLIITDLNMPRLDGIGVIERVRRSGPHAATPILVLSSESCADMREMARHAGATGWIVKPFSVGGLLDAIRRVAA
jgi:two-component system chemotaxis response regulator CheY